MKLTCVTAVFNAIKSGNRENLIRCVKSVAALKTEHEHLAEGVRVFLSRRYEREEIRREVVENYAYDKIARQYGEMYGKLRVEG